MNTINLSYHDTHPDYAGLKAGGIEAAYIHMTDGTYFRDGLAPDHVKGCREAGIAWGGYHGYEPTCPPADQAAYFTEYMLECGTDYTLDPACNLDDPDPLGMIRLVSQANSFCLQVRLILDDRPFVIRTSNG